MVSIGTALKRVWRWAFGGAAHDSRTASLPSGLSEHVYDTENLTRFITSRSHYNRQGAKPVALLPKNGKKSVFRHGEHPQDELWDLALSHLTTPDSLKGAAIFTAGDVRNAALEVEASEPPPRHADLVNWPDSTDPVKAKAVQKQVAARVLVNSRFLAYSVNSQDDSEPSHY